MKNAAHLPARVVITAVLYWHQKALLDIFARMHLLRTFAVFLTLTHLPLCGSQLDHTHLTDRIMTPVSTPDETLSPPSVASQEAPSDSNEQTTTLVVQKDRVQPDKGRLAVIREPTTGISVTPENSSRERMKDTQTHSAISSVFGQAEFDLATTTEKVSSIVSKSNADTPWLTTRPTSKTSTWGEEFSKSASITFNTPVMDEIQDFAISTESNLKSHDVLRTGTEANSFTDFNWKCSEEGEKLCGCTETCLEIENCCQDSKFINLTADNTSKENPAFSCYSDFTDKWALSPTSLLVDKCSKEWTDVRVRDFCEQPNTDEVQSYVPCYSSTTRLSYRNVHCLQCNGLSDPIPWEVTFQSGVGFDFSFIDSFIKMNGVTGRPIRYRGQQFVISAKPGFEPAHCMPLAIGTCQPEVTTDKSRMLLCQSYYRPVIVDSNAYRNIDCFECYTGIDRDDALIKKIFRQREASMSVLLDVFVGMEESKPSRCQGSSCRPTLTHVRGLCQEFAVSINVTRAHAPGRNMSLAELSAIEDIPERWTSQLEAKLADRLNKYDYDLKLYKEKYDVWDAMPHEVKITVRDNIPVQAIPDIQKEILSLEFDLDIVHVMHCSFRLEAKFNMKLHEEDWDVATTLVSNKTSGGDTNAADRQDGVTLACLLAIIVISSPSM